MFLGLFIIYLSGTVLPSQFDFSGIAKENFFGLSVISLINDLDGNIGTLLRIGFVVFLGASSLSLMVLRLDRIFGSVSTVKNLVARSIGGMSLASGLGLCFVSASAEEILFRGALQSLMGLPLALIAYVFVHAGPGGLFSGWTLQSLIIGSGLGVLFHLTKSLPLVIMVHFVVNIAAFIQVRWEFSRAGAAAFIKQEIKSKASGAGL